LTSKVIDTNVILHHPFCLNQIQGTIYLTTTVLSELDSFKKSQNELSRNVREFTRQLANHPNIEFYEDPQLLQGDNDSKIIQAAKVLKATLITNDLLMSYRAKAAGIPVEGYDGESRGESDQFTGISEGDSDYIEIDDLYPNEYLHSGKGKIERYDGKSLISLGKDRNVWGIRHKNLEQKCLIDALMNDDIKLVTISGKAGTGKTLLSLACALEKVINENKYTSILVARPIVPMGNELGFLPGTAEEKMSPWMKPIQDNLEFLFNNNAKASGKTFEELSQQGIIQVEALSFIRGRSIPNQFIIIDEAQNLTAHEMKTILTRVGEGTKIILTGDPEQIDSPKLDSVNNGLSTVIEKFKNQKIAAHITLTKGERSELANIAAEIL
jgi:PhoH-like ATPase